MGGAPWDQGQTDLHRVTYGQRRVFSLFDQQLLSLLEALVSEALRLQLTTVRMTCSFISMTCDETHPEKEHKLNYFCCVL